MPCYTFVYTRRSSEDDDRQVLSLDAQERECRLFLSRDGTAIDDLIRESHSARKPGRPLFNTMLAQAEAMLTAGKAVRVLCHKPDRLLRNLADWSRINDLVDLGLQLDFITGSFPNNAQGKMAFGIMALSAKYYVDNLSEEVRKGMRQKVERGEWPHKAPLGYRNVRDASGYARVELDPEVSPLVRRAFEYYATGEYSLSALAKAMYAAGLTGNYLGKRLSPGYLQDRLLTNPFYFGYIRYRGELRPGVHPPIVSPDLFRLVQAVMHRASRPRPIRHHFRYGGLLRCSTCKGVLVGDIKKKRYVYYRCTGHRSGCRRYLPERKIDRLVHEGVTARLSLSSDATGALRSAAANLHADELRANERDSLKSRLAATEKKLAALLDLRLAGMLSDEQFSAKRRELQFDAAEAHDHLRRVELPREDPRKAVDWFVSTCNEGASVIPDGTDGEIRTFLRIVGSNYRLADESIEFEPAEPFNIARQVRTYPLWWTSEEDVRNWLIEVEALMQRSTSTDVTSSPSTGTSSAT